MNIGKPFPLHSVAFNTAGCLSMRAYLVRSWLLLAAAAFLATCTVTSILFYLSYQNLIARIEDDLGRIGPQIARRLAGELLIGDSGLPNQVIQTLKEAFHLPLIQLLPLNLSCSDLSGAVITDCSRLANGRVWKSFIIPSIAENRSVLLGIDAPDWIAQIQWNLLLLGAVPILVISCLGIFLQWKFLQLKVLLPVSSLLALKTQPGEVNHWPTELINLAAEFMRLLQERDRALGEVHHLKTQALLGDFANGVIHDCQRPLMKAGMLIDASQEISSSLRRQLQSLMDTPRLIIRDHLKRIQNLSTYKYFHEEPVQAGSLHSTVSLGAVARKLIDESHFNFKSKNVTLMVDLPKKAFVTFVALSFTDLLRAVSNILENALDASTEGKRVVLSVMVGKESAELLVRDFGGGFDPQIMTAITTGKPSSTKGSQGNGLGILTTMATVKRAGGTTSMSSLDDGTLVRIALPIVADPAWFSNIHHRRETKILILDDNLEIKGAVVSAFPGKSVAHFEDEVEFLKAARSDEQALLLVDFEYGGRSSGLELIVSHELQSRAVLFSEKPFFDEELTRHAFEVGCGVFPKGCLG